MKKTLHIPILLLIIALGTQFEKSQAQIPNYVPTNSLVAWYPFNGNYNDESGSGNIMTSANLPTLTADRFGICNSAYRFFPGNNLFKSTPNTNGQTFTWAVWIKKISTGIDCHGIGESNATSTSGGGFNVSYNIPQVTCQGISVNVTNSTTVINNGIWYHYVITKTGNSFSIYINGILNSSGNSTYLPYNSTTYCSVGGNPSADCEIDDIAMWNRVLSQSEITALYNGNPPNTNGTIISSQPVNLTISASNNAQYFVSSTNPNSTYQWQTDLGTGFQNISNAGQYSGVTNDTLTISNVGASNNNQLFRCIVNSSTCTDTSDIAALTVTGNTGFGDPLNSNPFNIYPNPANEQIIITGNSGVKNNLYQIVDVSGQIVMGGVLAPDKTVIDIRSLSSGSYFIITFGSESHSRIFIKR